MLFPNINDVSDILTISLWCQPTPKVRCPRIQPTVVCVMAQSPKSPKPRTYAQSLGRAFAFGLAAPASRTHPCRWRTRVAASVESFLFHTRYTRTHLVQKLLKSEISILAGHWGLPRIFPGFRTPKRQTRGLDQQLKRHRSTSEDTTAPASLILLCEVRLRCHSR